MDSAHSCCLQTCLSSDYNALLHRYYRLLQVLLHSPQNDPFRTDSYRISAIYCALVLISSIFLTIYLISQLYITVRIKRPTDPKGIVYMPFIMVCLVKTLEKLFRTLIMLIILQNMFRVRRFYNITMDDYN